MSTFTYLPDWGAEPEVEQRVRSVKFGDGYEQVSPDGLNPMLPVWKLTFSVRTQSEAQAIYSWLNTNNASVTSFDWAAPGEGTASMELFGTGNGSQTTWSLIHLSRPVRYTGIPTLYRTDWQGTYQLSTTPRTNLLLGSTFAGGGAAPSQWTQPTATGTSTPVASIYPGAPGVAYLQTATAERPYFSQNVTWLANTTYCLSVLVESVSGLQAQDILRHGSSLPSGSITYPACQANPSGGSSGTLTTGVLVAVIAIGATGGAGSARTGIGPVTTTTGTVQFSHPQLEVGTARTGFIPTTTAAVTITDYTISGTGLVTFGQVPAVAASLQWSGSYVRRHRAKWGVPKPDGYNSWSITAEFREVPL